MIKQEKTKSRGRPKKHINKLVQARLSDEEFTAYQQGQGNASLIRFLIRDWFGLCTHSITSTNWLGDGTPECNVCGAKNPEIFAHHYHEFKMVDDPPSLLPTDDD